MKQIDSQDLQEKRGIAKNFQTTCAIRSCEHVTTFAALYPFLALPFSVGARRTYTIYFSSGDNKKADEEQTFVFSFSQPKAKLHLCER